MKPWCESALPRASRPRSAPRAASLGRFRFRGQSVVGCQRVENFRVSLGPGIVDRDAFETPFLPVAHQLAIVAVRQECVLPAATQLTEHELPSQNSTGLTSRVSFGLQFLMAQQVADVNLVSIIIQSRGHSDFVPDVKAADGSICFRNCNSIGSRKSLLLLHAFQAQDDGDLVADLA